MCLPAAPSPGHPQGFRPPVSDILMLSTPAVFPGQEVLQFAACTGVQRQSTLANKVNTRDNLCVSQKQRVWSCLAEDRTLARAGSGLEVSVLEKH